MIHLSDKATELGGRTVTTLKMLNAIARRIDWTKPKVVCWDVFDQAEGHAGGRRRRRPSVLLEEAPRRGAGAVERGGLENRWT